MEKCYVVVKIILSKKRSQRSRRMEMEYFQGNSLLSSHMSLLLQLTMKDMIKRESSWHSHPKNFPAKETLKLFLYLREVYSPRNGSLQESDLFLIILRVLKLYWEMAGFPTLTDTNIKMKLTPGELQIATKK